MKSLVCYGPKQLKLDEVESPQITGQGEVIIAISSGGICGSDLHYYNNGGFGAIRIKEPMTLGHEVSGHVVEVSDDVSDLNVGDLVAINPSVPCYNCEYCEKAHYNHCFDMRYYGSAMRFPHVQGAFSQQLLVQARQCEVLSKDVTGPEGACAEPMSVALHAINRVGSLTGKKVIVMGTGPIGALTVAAAKLHGALEVVATDVVDEALVCAEQMGADQTINVATSDDIDVYKKDKGYFDVVIEASGSPAAMNTAAEVIRPRGRWVQLGLGGEASIPPNLVSKEIEIMGSFRFHEEFSWACDLINRNRINLKPILTNIFPVEEAIQAFESANGSQSSKVIINFQPSNN